ncbi:MAG: flippase-like domain-containing protein [Candidatus Methylomirabilales bacterium]
MQRPWGKLVALFLGLFIFIWVLRQVGLEETAAQIRKVGWNFLPLLLPSFLMWILFSLGWWWTVPPRISFPNLLLVRTAGEAVNTTTPLAYLGGEPLKASLLSRYGIPLTDGLASVVVTKTASTFAYCLFIFTGLATALFAARDFSFAMVGGTAAGLLLGVGVLVLYYGQRRGLFSLFHRIIYRMGVRGRAWIKKRGALANLDSKIDTLYQNRKILSGCLLFSVLAWLASPIETYFFLWALGTPVEPMTAIAIQALVLGVKASTFFIPGGIGAQEGGNVLIFLGLGMSPETAMAYSLLRRGREIAWILIGLAVLTRFGWGELKASPEMETGA